MLFTDVDMPGMVLAGQVHQRWPHIRLVISSGYAHPHPDEIPDNGHFVPKPYCGATLVRNITEMIQIQYGP